MESSGVIILFILCSLGMIAGIALVNFTHAKKLILPENDKWYSGFMLSKGQEHWLLIVGVAWVLCSLFGFVVVAKQYFGTN